MNLFCIWTRRACSRFAAMDEPVPAESRLAAHMQACQECRDYWAGMTMLARDLDQMVGVPQPSPRFAEPTWERVPPAQRGFEWGRLSLAAVAACGLACGWVAWRAANLNGGSSTAPAVAVRDRIKLPPDEAPHRGPVAPGLVPAPRGDAKEFATTEPRSAHSRHLRWSRPAGDRVPDRLLAGTRRQGLHVDPDRGRETAAGLRQSGMVLEAQGDPGLANVAYQAAFQAHPSEDTAFDMGRSAEESGDMEQAMSVYAGLLDTADVKSRREKGWTP